MVATSVQHPKAPLSGASEPPPETDGVLNDQDVSALLTETHVRPRWFAAVGTSRQSCWPEDSSSSRESLRRIDLFRSTFVLAMVHEAAGILRPRNFEDSNRSHHFFLFRVETRPSQHWRMRNKKNPSKSPSTAPVLVAAPEERHGLPPVVV